MDNIAHSLAGVTLGCALIEAIPGTPSGRAPRFGAAVLWTSFIANNLPDFDSAISELFEPGHLGQLLSHRGFTHSFAFVPLGGAISAVIGIWVALQASRLLRKSPKERSFGAAFRDDLRACFWKMALVGAMGILLHLFMDWWNDYGIHPFWPFWNGWIHLDTMSVVEPLLWLALLPFAWILSEGTRVRHLVFGLWGGVLGLVWLGPFTRGWVAIAATAWGGLAWALQAPVARRRGVARSWFVAAGLSGAVFAAFFTASRIARARVMPFLGAEKLEQLIRTPAPSDPFCWRVISVSERASARGPQYVMRYGVVSLWPGLANPASCFYGAFDPKLAPLQPVQDVRAGGAAAKDVAWVGEFVRPVSEFERISRGSCVFETFRRFSRAPFWVRWKGHELFGDLRYDRGLEPGFSTVLDSDSCLRWEPSWLYQS